MHPTLTYWATLTGVSLHVWTAIVFAVSLGASCQLPAATQIERKPAIGSNRTPLMDTLLKGRVEARWAALIAREFGDAYTYQTPSYRRVFSKRRFVSQFGDAVGWITADVVDIQLDAERGTAVVLVDVHFKTILPGTDRIIRSTRRMREIWVNEDDNWWHVSE